MPPREPPFSDSELEQICRVVADTESGITGAQIGRYLALLKVKDTDPRMTKWKRLFNALTAYQNKTQSGSKVLGFIAKALDPVRFRDESARFETLRDGVNVTLAFRGLEFREDGKFVRVKKAATLRQAEEMANRLRSALQRRGVHPDVLSFCRAEFLQGNPFHAVLEATKSIADKLRSKTGLTYDGAQLVDAAFGGSAPLLTINNFVTDTEKGEQRGFVNLLKGLFGTFRNPTAHAPRKAWPMSEEDALDLFCIASYAHRRIDAAR